jgi:hypothetical protein
MPYSAGAVRTESAKVPESVSRSRPSAAVLGGRPDVAVGVEDHRGAGVAESSLHGHDVTSGGDEPAGIKVPHVVEPDALADAGLLLEGQPRVMHRIGSGGSSPSPANSPLAAIDLTHPSTRERRSDRSATPPKVTERSVMSMERRVPATHTCRRLHSS